MNYQRKVEFEDSFIESHGQHPLWVYERQVRGRERISYEKFLERATCGFTAQADEPPFMVVSDHVENEYIAKEPENVILTPVIGVCNGENKDLPKIEFESFLNIDSGLVERTSRRLGRHTYRLFKQIRPFSVEEWKTDSKAFLLWLDQELNYSDGKKLIQINLHEPYGPDNCMLSGNLRELFAPINEKHHTDFAILYASMGRVGKFCREWSSNHAFLHWLQHHEKELPDYTTIERIDASKEYGPVNCRFKNGNEKKKAVHEYQATVKEKIELAAHYGDRCGLNPYMKYRTLVSAGTLDPVIWPLEQYLDWVIDLAIHSELGPYLNLLDKDAPYAPGNAYYSWRLGSIRTHGMSNTKLYRKYLYFKKHYREQIKPEDQVSFEVFMETALKEKDYQLNSRMKINHTGNSVSMDDVEFIEDPNDMDDIIRICSLFQAIPKKQNAFGGLMDFMEWTIRQGYQPWMDFKKIGTGDYSQETCVWDVFSEEGYVASKGQRILRMYRGV